MSQQWEYCILTTGLYTVPLDPPISKVYAGVTFCQTSSDITKEIVRKELPAEAREVVIEPRELTQAIARLGSAGWEMLSVHINRTNTGSSNMVFFKRPVEPGRAIDDAF
ncbi:MAG TPA: hypothetical protein VFU63_13010 [Ktedonobacterales bacterium]|nr:hypothetical protein [Ktedonobacterales bacterium]